MIHLDSKSRKAVLKINSMGRLTREGIEYALYQSGKSMVRTTSNSILQKPKGGKTYIIRTKSGRKRRHIASAPGQSHANITGRARRSLSFKVRPNELEFGYGVTKNDAPDYADFLEFGTKKMEPRPSLQNGINDEQANVVRYLKGQIGKRLGDKI